MDAFTEETPGARTRKPKATKAPSRKSTTKVKASLMLTEDVDFRLTVHAAALRLDRSTLANQLLDAGLKRFVVQDRGRPDATDDPPGDDA
jgi:hypothetical protein